MLSPLRHPCSSSLVVGLYLCNDLKFSRRSDLDISDDGIESCWIELARTAQKNIVLGCVYRHPKGNRDLFHSILKKELEQLKVSSRVKNHNIICYNLSGMH